MPAGIPRARRRRSTVRSHATKLGKVRYDRGYTQADFADIIGISLSSLQRLEAGEVADPGINLLHRCARVLAVPLARILEDSWKQWPAHIPPPARSGGQPLFQPPAPSRPD